MDPTGTIEQLAANHDVFRSLLHRVPVAMRSWKAESGKWSLLEVLCHLHDEEIEDFRTRLRSILEDPEQAPPPIDPQGWVTVRDYGAQDFDERLERLLAERRHSIEWLSNLEAPNWDNTWVHPEGWEFSAGMVLANWLAHDYHHMRQINRIKYEYHRSHNAEVSLQYAGEW